MPQFDMFETYASSYELTEKTILSNKIGITGVHKQIFLRCAKVSDIYKNTWLKLLSFRILCDIKISMLLDDDW